MITNGNPDNLKHLLISKTKEYDAKFSALESSSSRLVLSIERLTFMQHWSKAVPLSLVFWLTTLIVGGQASVALIKYFLP
jgi:hypothetical protein